jgi:5-methylcytosine-specific restriction protein A
VRHPCLDCTALIDVGSRCRSCKAALQARRDARRGTPSQRGYDSAWVTVSKRARQQQGWCSNCGATYDLTADHIVPLRLGGTSDEGNVIVLCRSCNGAKGARYA